MLVYYVERWAMMAMDYDIKIEFNIRLINLLTDAGNIHQMGDRNKNL